MEWRELGVTKFILVFELWLAVYRLLFSTVVDGEK